MKAKSVGKIRLLLMTLLAGSTSVAYAEDNTIEVVTPARPATTVSREENEVSFLPAPRDGDLLRRLEQTEAELNTLKAWMATSMMSQGGLSSFPVEGMPAPPMLGDRNAENGAYQYVVEAPIGLNAASAEAPDGALLAPPGASMTAPPPGSAVGGGPSDEAESGEVDPAEGANMPTKPLKLPLNGRFGNGFELFNKNDEYTLQFHNLTQIDYRAYEHPSQTVPGSATQNFKDTFAIPRQWFIFSGKLSKPFEYYVSLAEGFDNVNILDVFLNIHYDDRLQLKVGRYKTPFTYEFYNGPINGLINPERSLFFNNFGLNRDVGAMLHGQLFDKKVDYATGMFNGMRNAFLDANNAKDWAWYLNFKPWLDCKGHCLENLQFGVSMEYGDQMNAPVPSVYRTTIATTGNNIVGVPFMALVGNPAGAPAAGGPPVWEIGQRNFWSPHLAYYYKHLSFISEYQFGYQSYGFTPTPQTTFAIPIQSFYAQAGYFLTGETVTGRGQVRPLKPFDVRKGKIGPGAWELTARYNTLNIGSQVFADGLSNPALYTNAMYLTDVGFNWYLTRYVKVAFDWEHDVFSAPTLYQPGFPAYGKQKTADLFLTRLQIFF